MTDSALIHEYLTGSQHAFAELVRRHADWLFSMARRRLRDAQLAEDVTQAVFVVLARKAHRLREDTILPAWLFEVARLSISRALRDQSRRRRRETLMAAARQDELMRQDPNDRHAAWREISPLLDQSVARLRASDRNALLLRFYQQKTFSEVAAAIGTSEEAARKRVTRAVERLREMLAARGAAVPAISLPGLLIANITTSAPPTVASAATTIAAERARQTVVQLAKGAILMMAWQKARVAMISAVIVCASTAIGIATIRQATNHAGAAASNSTTAPAQPPLKVTSVTPILKVQDLAVSLDFYVNKLGFVKQWEWGDPPDFASIARDDVELFLAQGDQGQSGAWVYIAVSDVNVFHSEITGRGADVQTPPQDRPWGMREMIIEDPDGHHLRVGSVFERSSLPSTPKKP